MKKKWYRSSLIKVILTAVLCCSAALGAVCAARVIMMDQYGISLWEEEGKTYTETSGFAAEMYEKSREIIRGIRSEELIKADSSVKQIAGVEALAGDGRISGSDTSGFAYYLEDLEQWVSDGWEYSNYGFGSMEECILVCKKKDSAYRYFYADDFLERLENKEFTVAAGEESIWSASERLADAVASGEYFGGISELGIRSITWNPEEEEYTNIWAYNSVWVSEKYSPVGAESIVELANRDARWNGRISEAYGLLITALDKLSAEMRNREILNDYLEGNTNLTYLWADPDHQKILSNHMNYREWSDYKADCADKIAAAGAYVIIRPKLADCETNLKSENGSLLQEWHHYVEQTLAPDLEDYVFVAAVDRQFPVADDLASSREAYDVLSGEQIPLKQQIPGVLLMFAVSLVWLTAIAGKRSADEEIHLNAADGIFVEIMIGGLLAVWIAGLYIAENLVGFYQYFSREAADRFVAVAGLTGFGTAVLGLAGYLSLVRRIKGRTLWKSMLLRWILLHLRNTGKKCLGFFRIFAVNTSSKIKIMAIMAGFFAAQLILMMMAFDSSPVFLLFVLVLDAAAAVWFFNRAAGRDRILEGLRRITGGELQYKIPVEVLKGEQKTMAEYINHIGEGLDAAVENSLKQERMKTELITNVSHDIKTPLTSIINYVDLLQREPFDDPKIVEYLKVLEEKSQRLKILTEDVVEASKASSGAISLEIVKLNFVELLHQVMGEFEEKFTEKNLTLMVHLENQPVMIMADGRRLWRVLENIFSNVVKYAMEGTRVYAETVTEKGKISFSLKNISAQPLNIPAEELTERFIRGDVSRNTEGSGLGLSIARSLTELQGGEFRLYLDGDLFKVTIAFPLS